MRFPEILVTLAEGKGGHGGGGIDVAWYVMVFLIIAAVVIVLLVMCLMCHVHEWVNISSVEQTSEDIVYSAQPQESNVQQIAFGEPIQTKTPPFPQSTDTRIQTNGENYSLHPDPWFFPPPYDSLGYSNDTPEIPPPALQ